MLLRVILEQVSGKFPISVMRPRLAECGPSGNRVFCSRRPPLVARACFQNVWYSFQRVKMKSVGLLPAKSLERVAHGGAEEKSKCRRGSHKHRAEDPASQSSGLEAHHFEMQGVSAPPSLVRLRALMCDSGQMCGRPHHRTSVFWGSVPLVELMEISHENGPQHMSNHAAACAICEKRMRRDARRPWRARTRPSAPRVRAACPPAHAPPRPVPSHACARRPCAPPAARAAARARRRAPSPVRCVARARRALVACPPPESLRWRHQ